MTDSPSANSSQPGSSSVERDRKTAARGGMKRLVRFLPIMLLVGVLVGAVYAGFVATHTFTYPSTVAGIVNKSYGLAFTANEVNATLTTCGATPPSSCFSVTTASSITVTASSSLSGTGVTLLKIYVIPLTQYPCSPTPPTNTSGLIKIPLPTEAPISGITLNGLTDYDYCIYYTSAPSISTGVLTINYSSP